MSYICKDCGVDTTPCTGKRGCRHGGRWEHYMVKDAIWKAAKMPPGDGRFSGKGFLCIGCLETRIGRQLKPKDFTTAPINRPGGSWNTPRLEARLRG